MRTPGAPQIVIVPALASLLAVCSGCPLIIEGPATLVGAIVDGSSPAGVPSPDRGIVAHGSVAYDGMGWLGLSVYCPEDASCAVSIEATFDLGAYLKDMSLDLDWKDWITIRPVAGLWTWRDAPETAGPLTGVRIGLGHVARRGDGHRVARLEYGRITLRDVAGNGNAVTHTIALSVVW